MADQHDAPRTPEGARSEIERTRARMSETLDEIEEVLIRKKEHLRESMNVGARLREKPLVIAGVVLGAGFLIGFVTGGKDKKGEAERVAAQARAALWEERARRLMAIAREQEEDLEEMEDAVLDAAAPAGTGSRWRYTAPSPYVSLVDEEDDLDLLDDELDDLLVEFDDDALEDRYSEADLFDEDDEEDLVISRKRGKLVAREEREAGGGSFLANFARALIEGIRKQL